MIGPIFGMSATTVGEPEVLAGLPSALGGLAFDAAGNLYITEPDARSLQVLAPASGRVFGVSAGADELTTIVAPGLGYFTAMTTGPDGNLFVASGGLGEPGVMFTLPYRQYRTGGKQRHASPLSTVPIGTGEFRYLASDSSGDLYVTGGTTSSVSVLAAMTGRLFGHAVTKGRLSVVLSGLSDPDGIAIASQWRLIRIQYR